MNASAYLERHGWRGAGTSLDAGGQGLTKPLLVSQKQNLLGVGATTKATQWDTWWSTSLDCSLQRLQVANAKASKPAAARTEMKDGAAPNLEPPRSASSKPRQYGGFVREEDLEGTTKAPAHGTAATSGTALTSELGGRRESEALQETTSKRSKRKRRKESGVAAEDASKSAAAASNGATSGLPAIDSQDPDAVAAKRKRKEDRRRAKRSKVAAAPG